MIRDMALLGARLAVGGGMAAHGAQKALGWFNGPGPEKAGQLMENLGFRPGETYGALAAWNEIGSGILIAAGFGGPIGPAMLISNMIVAQTTVHAPNGFFAQDGGIELGVVYSAAALVFASTDYGSLSLDAATGLHKKLHHPWFTTLVLAGGVAAAIVLLNGRNTTPDGPATPTFRGTGGPAPEGGSANEAGGS
jgi:putative oxidoreductase